VHVAVLKNAQVNRLARKIMARVAVIFAYYSYNF